MRETEKLKSKELPQATRSSRPSGTRGIKPGPRKVHSRRLVSLSDDCAVRTLQKGPRRSGFWISEFLDLWIYGRYSDGGAGVDPFGPVRTISDLLRTLFGPVLGGLGS